MIKVILEVNACLLPVRALDQGLGGHQICQRTSDHMTNFLASTKSPDVM
jgi:hypothetical protein